MKKLLLVLIAVMGLSFAANAQDAIGVRLGRSNGYGGEISYWKGLGSNRLEVDLGFSGGDYINLAGIYQFKGNIANDFGWFAGPGLNAGYCINHGFGLAILLQGGVEFNPSSLPVLFSLDFRPSFDFLIDKNCGYSNLGYGFALGIRYKL